MPYNKEVIFSSLEEAYDFYKSFGFILTKDKRLILNRKTEVEIKLHKLGPSLLRSSVTIIESE